ncbi:hypothetical protein CCR75_004371 [Bremia lactucae]|uniref:Uncharacterized protein n=1 Tax=Bremia lactucae TaxID=4779 RepID=A0A976FJN1_BRELC|nr:hypothetical protein CCR75_004371 [Bremia lactucae]
MSSLIVDTMGDVAFEVMAAASLAAVASLAAIGVHCTKRQNGCAHAMTPASKKTRMKSRDKAVEHTHPVL